ncbi:TPA: hypothetical protein ENX78_13965 [Candidatus Poribacteria bacterium]|nr:hypothetical protein [Candidatus Poribacteria bacterium]
MLNIIFLAFLTIISFGVGYKVLKLFRIKLDNSLERFVFSSGIGLGIISYLTLLLAVLELLYKWACLLLLFLLLIISLWGIWRNKDLFSTFKRKIPRSIRLEKAYIFEYCLIIILFFYILLCFLYSLAPPVDWDSLVYHLSIPKIWIQNHKAIHIPYINQSENHLTTENIFTLGMIILNNETFPCLLIWLTSLWLILAIYSLCLRYLSPRTGILAMSAFYCTPFISWLSSRPMVDIPYILYAFLGFYAFFKYLYSKDLNMLLLSGIMSGFSASCKQFGVIPFIALFLIISIIEIKKRNNIINGLNHIFLFSLLFLLIIAPWIIKCYINTGEFFSTWHSGALLLLGQAEKTELELPSIWNKIGYILRSTTNIPEFILIGNLFYRSPSGSLWSPGIFMMAFLPCLIFLRKTDRIIKYMLIYSIVVISVSAILPYPSRNIRLIGCILPVVFISCSYIVYRLLNDYESIAKYIKVLIVISVLFNIIPVVKWTYAGLPIVFKMENKIEYLDRRIKIGSALEYVNKNLSDNDRILSLEQRVFYFEKPYTTILTIIDLILKDSMMDEPRCDISKLIERLKSEKITHLFSNDNYVNTGYGYLPKDLMPYLELIYSKNLVYVYKINLPNNVPTN